MDQATRGSSREAPSPRALARQRRCSSCESRAGARGKASILEATLGAEPEGEGGDLCGAGVDIDAVKVVVQDQLWGGRCAGPPTPGSLRGGYGRWWQLGAALGSSQASRRWSAADRSVEQEVAGAARRVEDPKVARVLLGAKADRVRVLRGLSVVGSLLGIGSPSERKTSCCRRTR